MNMILYHKPNMKIVSQPAEGALSIIAQSRDTQVQRLTRQVILACFKTFSQLTLVDLCVFPLSCSAKSALCRSGAQFYVSFIYLPLSSILPCLDLSVNLHCFHTYNC